MATLMKPVIPQSVYDQLARVYFSALRCGHLIEPRPEIGEFWAIPADDAEPAVRKADGDLEAIGRVFAGLFQRYPALRDLLGENDIPKVSEEKLVPALPDLAWLPEDLSSGACSFLERYVAFSKEASPEGYEHFHVFCGLFLLSTVAARRVYLPLRRKKIYTNLMISLFSKSSTWAKSTTAQVALDILYEADLGFHLTPKRISPQKLCSDMAGAHYPTDYPDMSADQQERVRRRLGMSGQRGMYSDEFGKFIKAALRKQSTTADFISLFLEFDSCPKDFDSATFSRGGENIAAPYLALLGCVTPPDFRETGKSGAEFWNDGMWGRYAFVAAPAVSEQDETLDQGELPIPPEFIATLLEWHTQLGEPECILSETPDKDNQPSGKYIMHKETLKEHRATMDDDAHDAYKRYRSALKKLYRTFPHDDFNASYARLPEIALRMALLMASLENKNHIQMRHWARAQELGEILRASLHEMYAQVNISVASTSEKATIEHEIERHLRKHGALTLNTLRTSYMKKRSVEELEKALAGMERGKIITNYPTAYGTLKYQLRERRGEED